MKKNTEPAFELYDYQKRWVNDTSRYAIAMFSRQCGKTFTSQSFQRQD